MNTKQIPAILALIAGFVTCIMSFVQGVDIVVFAKRFIIVCIIFFVIGTIISVVIYMNFKDMPTEAEEENPTEDEGKEKETLEEQENAEAAVNDEE